MAKKKCWLETLGRTTGEGSTETRLGVHNFWCDVPKRFGWVVIKVSKNVCFLKG